jgi:hypothetical protein
MFCLCSDEVTLSTYHLMDLETVLTCVVVVLGSCGISVFLCPFAASALISVGLEGRIEPDMLLASHLCNSVLYTFQSSLNSIRDR